MVVFEDGKKGKTCMCPVSDVTGLLPFRSVLIRIRFGAADFRQVVKKKELVKIETGVLCGIGFGDGA